ncbi:hypothetical protein KUTeg_000588 [Tegillarca granosa]|uniref:Mab-21-like HhH/H2TH-like domain-containing protein n=1 Tax=Tegillarca granosa TaxID=220873 RepID=A0ABQ9FXY5_TEGGR|nr:hypothetical protein KUTeg_000588 [Tegillarca granosa]
MEKFSLMIWNELSRFAGMKEQIFIRSHRNGIPISCVYSGSRAEGLLLPGSDIDVICNLCVRFLFCPVSDLIIDTTNIKPGFVRLRCHDNISYPYCISSALVKTDNGSVLSRIVFRDTVVNILQTVFPSSVAHGPCLTFVIPPLKTESDLLFCFSCKTWPVVAYEWIDRYRNNSWPPHDLISDIERDGCLVVPIGNPNSPETEKKLVHSINHTQLLCYGLLKLYLRHVVNSNTEIKDLICSYFLKTCLFYCIEEECIIWNKENFLNCFWTCFRRFIKWVKDEYCQNYFIKENNMFEGKVCGEKGKILLQCLTKLYNEGLYKLHHCKMYTLVPAENAITVAEREGVCDSEIVNVLVDTIHNSDAIRCMVLLADMVQTSTSNIDRQFLLLNVKLLIYKKQTYMDEVGGKGLTLYQKFNRDIFACTYICRVDCNFYPLEIEQELIRHSIGNEVDINPFVYSYVLMFLSYLHMSSRQNMVDTLSELYSTVKERISDDEFETPLNNSLVEKCIHLSESWHYSRTKKSFNI